MPLSPGTRVGSYEITASIGAGGMGEVYRARDSKLKRDVAIKVLPADVANDPERLARFHREAEVLASLNHPHIAQVYGIENPPEGGHHSVALVMELVEGEDLAERLKRGPIAIDEALPIAKQIAEALEAAHDAGIIHRDLKPANIKVRDDGTVKVLDFGLAKALDLATSSPGLANSPTITSPAMTQRGVILGTAAYMSPEQAKGKFVDKRADIWAFGCVLYEMLTGRRGFQGEDATDTIAEVLKSSVNMAALPGETPARIVALINSCLQRDPKMRLRDIGDARLALTDRGAADDPPATASRAPVRTRERVAWLLVAVLAVAAAILAFRPAAEPPLPNLVRFTLEVNSDPSAIGVIVAMSPDGSTLALQPNGAGEALLLRRLGGEEFVRVEGTAGARAFAWSPDSRSLAFVSGGELKVVDLGGSVRSLARTPEGVGGSTSMAWGATGTILVAFNAAPLHVLHPETSRLEPIGPMDLAIGEREQAAPVFHPDGKRFFYLSSRNQVTQAVTLFRSLDAGPIQELSGEDRILWAGEEHVVFRRGTTLLAQRIGYAPLALQGAPVQLVSNIEPPILSRTANGSVSPGALAVRNGTTSGQQFIWLGRQGQVISRVGPEGQYPTFALSEDGTRIAVSRREPSGQSIWIMDAAKGTMNRATIGPVSDVDPRFGPDGRSVMFASSRDPFRSPYRVGLAGQPPERVLAFKGAMFALDDWSADGQWMIYHGATGGAGTPAIKAVRLDRVTDEPITVATALTGVLDQAVMSGDGRWVAFNATESGRPEVFVVPFPPTGDKWQVSVNGGAQPMWHRGGRELYYMALDGTLMAVPIKAGDTFAAGDPISLFRSPVASVSISIEQYAPAPDGSRFLFAPYSGNSSTASLTILTNWQRLLGQ